MSDTKNPQRMTDEELYEEHQGDENDDLVLSEIARRWMALFENGETDDGAYIPEYDHEQVRVTCIVCEFSRLYPLGNEPAECYECGGERLDFEWPAEVGR